jgi:osmotically-inducible protein OsmY
MRPLTLIAAAAASVAAYYYLKDGVRRRAIRRAARPRDAVIGAAVRQKLAGVIADPAAIHVTVHGGNVSLRGPVREGERDAALTAVLDVPGVLQVTNFLEPSL